MNAPLWAIAEDLEVIAGEIAENGGELTPELEARLDALDGAFEAKVERVALASRTYAAHAEAAKTEEARLAAIRKSLEGRADALKRYLLGAMRRTGTLKVETPRARVRVQKNGQPTITWTRSLDELPEAYRRVTVAPDVAMARDTLRAGGDPPDGFAVDYGFHVRIQ
jgi:hypothetical protein